MHIEKEHERRSLLRAIPPVNRIADDERVLAFGEVNGLTRNFIVTAIQHELIGFRKRVLDKDLNVTEEEVLDFLVEGTLATLDAWMSPRLRRVINGTGVVLHTNLGRALLSDYAVKHVAEAASYYSNLEYQIDDGERGSRHSHVEELICRLTGAEAAMVVNNNAAAVYIVLRALAAGREVIVSRGELVEIGGSFRVSEIMKESGAKLIEVGTTNKTHLRDYEQAIGDETVMMMKVHTSNFRIVGFTSSVGIAELADVGHARDVIVYEDLGSGVLFDLRPYGIGDEPTVKEALAAGADIVTFSGDKLLGGPQAGIIAGKKRWIATLKKHQAARMLRVDKLTLAGLEATLRQYLIPEAAQHNIPVLRDLLVAMEHLERKAKRFAEEVNTYGVQCEIVDEYSEVGGGTMPGVTVPTKAASLEVPNMAAHQLEERLRLGRVPVIVRVAKHRVIIDFRTVLDEEMDLLMEAVREAVKK